VDKLRAELRLPDVHGSLEAGMGAAGEGVLPAILLVLAFVVTWWLSTTRPKVK
jgi:hypothetical protein